jgi:hypothetical protein
MANMRGNAGYIRELTNSSQKVEMEEETGGEKVS